MQNPDELRQRMTAYLKEQSSKDLAEITAQVREDWGKLLDSVKGLSAAQANFHPSPDDYSVDQVMRHITLASEKYHERIAALVSGSAVDVHSVAGGLTEGDARTFPQALEAFQKVAQDVLSSVERGDHVANLDLTSRHNFFGPLNWREWLVLLAYHARDHLQQVEAIKAAPSFPKPM